MRVLAPEPAKQTKKIDQRLCLLRLLRYRNKRRKSEFFMQRKRKIYLTAYSAVVHVLYTYVGVQCALALFVLFCCLYRLTRYKPVHGCTHCSVHPVDGTVPADRDPCSNLGCAELPVKKQMLFGSIFALMAVLSYR
jgi:hypothetical protein